MATEKDKKVQELFKVVQQKKEEIAKAERPVWATNCSFGYNPKTGSERFNVQVVSDENDLVQALAFLLEKEASITKANELLNLPPKPFRWMGYSIDEWKSDFQTRIAKLQLSNKKKDLEILEKRLDALVSPELRAELELAEIEALLK